MFLQVIARARRRLLRNALAIECAHAASAGMGALVLMLVLGTDILSWRWIPALSAATFGVGVYIAWQRRPDAYKTAQLLDTRLRLEDTLSTAVFYWPLHPPRKCDEQTRLSQREQAARVATAVDVRAALPIQIARSIMLSLAVLAVLAAGLLLLRYRFDNRLELRHPALAALQQLLPVAQTEVAKLKRQFEMSAEERRGGDRETEGGGARDSSDFNPSGVEQSDNKDGEPGGVELAEKVENPETGSEEGWAENQGPDEDEQASGRNASSTRDESRAQKQEVQASGPKAEQPGNSSSLLAKVSDTLANLVSALKSKPNDAQRGKGEQTAKSGNSQRDVKSDRSSRGDAQGSAARSADGSGDPSQPDGGTSVHPDPNGSPRGGSGAGPDDGSKTVNLAEQLEAMGKISIILGKRSENITGRADLEATSGRPELKTGYEARQAEHRKVAATAQRDQIPIEFENYVQQYFGELRKAGTRAGRAPKRH